MSNANDTTTEITIEWEDRKHLGISLKASKEGLILQSESIIFKFTDAIHEALSILFCEPFYRSHEEVYETVINMDEASIANLISFGRKNTLALCGDDLLEKSVTMDMDDINTNFFKSALVGKLRHGDLLKKFWYQDAFNNGRRTVANLENSKSSSFANSVSEIMNFEDSYPIKLLIEHKTLGESLEQGWSYLDRNMLDLSANILVQSGSWGRLLNGLNQFKVLKTLDLSSNNLGRDACVALVSLMNTDGSSLTKLCLKRNQIDDECISILCAGLQNNKTLTTLDLEYNFSITQTGWKCLVNLICNKTDIDSTYHSNHTLQEVPKLSGDTIVTPELRPVFRDLRDNLVINKRIGNTARYKLWKTHFEVGVFDLNPFVDMDVQVIPQVLAWFANKSERRSCMRAVYHFIRNWDVPVLFGFPSAESIRIGKRTEELEKLVESLRKENVELREEIRVLEGGSARSSNSVDGQEKLKRRRNA